MEEFSKKLLAIYSTIIFFISLFISYIVFKGIFFLRNTGLLDQKYINIFYIILLILFTIYILFLMIIIHSILKGKEEDLRLRSNNKYIEWRLK